MVASSLVPAVRVEYYKWKFSTRFFCFYSWFIMSITCHFLAENKIKTANESQPVVDLNVSVEK